MYQGFQHINKGLRACVSKLRSPSFWRGSSQRQYGVVGSGRYPTSKLVGTSSKEEAGAQARRVVGPTRLSQKSPGRYCRGCKSGLRPKGKSRIRGWLLEWSADESLNVPHRRWPRQPAKVQAQWRGGKKKSV
ncbi:uncharacterized protein UV8b_07317 [Ustilaginoidea virens]|uniref:Uncharacterized protein n=1 Tax=Ustilaginoidea virens TaxID=1159556 RepID=A0A8E5MKP4_USTVR|nr:uncharacterized protein UV8b_07317 [Ustilaginoidea virens]QUC23076.1 hypothetical protein UV8b_07317 [Ustilaginoidea virens]